MILIFLVLVLVILKHSIIKMYWSKNDTIGTKYYGYVEDIYGNHITCEKEIKLDTVSPTCTSSGENSNWTNQNVKIDKTTPSKPSIYNPTNEQEVNYSFSLQFLPVIVVVELPIGNIDIVGLIELLIVTLVKILLLLLHLVQLGMN